MTDATRTEKCTGFADGASFRETDDGVEFVSNLGRLLIHPDAFPPGLEVSAVGRLLEESHLTREQIAVRIRDASGVARAQVDRLLGVLDGCRMIEDRETVLADGTRTDRDVKAELEFDATAQRGAFDSLITKLLLLGKAQAARELSETAVRLGLWKHPAQRPTRYLPPLKAKPIHDPSEFWFVELLEENYPAIREEFDRIVSGRNGDTESASVFGRVEDPIYQGKWDQISFYRYGERGPGFEHFPVTGAVVERIPEAASMVAGAIMFSWLHPGTHVVPHCGPTNARLRLHMGIRVPDGPVMRVADETFKWEEGKCVVFDDSFEHEVWHNGDEPRVVLIVDFWHPQLSDAQIAKIIGFGGRDPAEYGLPQR